MEEHFAVFSKDISCKSEGHVITQLKRNLSCSSYGNIVIPSTNTGIHQWTFLIGSSAEKSQIAIGVDKHNCAGINDDFYKQKSSLNIAYVSDRNDSFLFANGECVKPWGTTFHTDDVITMILDLSKRSLHFLVNGKDQGTAYKNILPVKTMKYRMAVSLSLPGDCVSLLSYSYIPMNENIDDNKDNESNDKILMKKYEELQITSTQHISEVNNKLNNMTDIQQQLITQNDKYMQENEYLKKENSRMTVELDALNKQKSQITQLQIHCNNLVNKLECAQKETQNGKNNTQQCLQKNEEILSQMNLLKTELDTTKNENMNLKTILEQVSSEYCLKLAESNSKYNELSKLNIEMQNNLLNVNDDYKEMSVKYNQLLKQQQQQRILNDTRNYKQWDHCNIADWICNVENKRFKQYEKELRVKLEDEGITGADIGDLDKNDLHRIGITNFGDKKALLKYIQHLIVQNSQNNENDEGIGTAFI
eukprot:421583_1